MLIGEMATNKIKSLLTELTFWWARQMINKSNHNISSISLYREIEQEKGQRVPGGG